MGLYCLDIDNVPQEHVDEQMHLQTRLVFHYESHHDKNLSSDQKDEGIRDCRPFLSGLQSIVHTSNLLYHAWLIKAFEVI